MKIYICARPAISLV